MNGNCSEFTIVVADPHRLVLSGIAYLLQSHPECAVVGRVTTAMEALQEAQRLQPHLLIFEFSFPDMSGLQLLRRVRPLLSNTRCVMMGNDPPSEAIVEAVRSGAAGVINKNLPTDLLIKAILVVARGGYWIDRNHVSTLLQSIQDEPMGGRYGLTRRELEVIAMISDGSTNRQIAQCFGVSEHTVKHHLTSIFDKLGVSTRLELAAFSNYHNLQYMYGSSQSPKSPRALKRAV